MCQIPHKEAHQVKPTHGHPSYIQQLCKCNTNHGLSLSEVDWGDPKAEPTKHGPSLMEVDWERKIKLNYTSN